MPLTDLIENHNQFLEEIGQLRDKLTSELEELETVAQFHIRAIERLKAEAGVNGRIRTHSNERALPLGITDPRLRDATRHEACAIALKELGGRAKTQQVADWLLERNYGKEFDNLRVFHNTCYTAMNRKDEMFEKVGRGEWKLL